MAGAGAGGGGGGGHGGGGREDLVAAGGEAPERRRRADGTHTALVVALISASQVATSQATRSAQVGFRAPFFVTCLHTSLMAACLPLARLLGARGALLGKRARSVALLLPLWAASNFCYVDALAFAQAGLVQTVFGAAPAAVAVLSRAFLAEPLTARRASAVGLAFAGVACIGVSGLAQGEPRSHQAAQTFVGVSLAGCAVLAAAGYKVGFKASHPDPPGAPSVLLFLGALGATAALLGLPTAAVLSAAGLEDRWWENGSQTNWPLLFTSAFLDVIYAVSLTFGLAVASPVFVALGAILGIPANLAVDAVVRGVLPSIAEAAGACLIVFSFALLAAAPAGPGHALAAATADEGGEPELEHAAACASAGGRTIAA